MVRLTGLLRRGGRPGVSAEVAQSWEGLLGSIDRTRAIGNASTLIAPGGPDYFVVHIRAIDETTERILEHRPAGRDTPISLYRLRGTDDLAALDSHSLLVGGGTPSDLQPLYSLAPTVASLSVQGPAIRGQRLRIADLPHVRALGAEWRILDLSGGMAPSLRRLSVDSYLGADLTALAVPGADTVESLSIIRSRSLTHLAGLTAFERLTHLTLYGCSALTDLSALAGLSSLRHVSLEGCRKVQGVHGVLPPAVETLALTDCGAIDSITPLAAFPTLQRVALNGDTVVQDRDLSPLLGLPALHSVLVASRRGYEPSAAELCDRFDWQPVAEPC